MSITQPECVCVCSLRYLACKAHAPYCQLWPAPLYKYFPHYLKNGTIFGGKKVSEHKMCFDYLYNVCLSVTFLVLRRNKPDMTKNVYWSSCNLLTPWSRVLFEKLTGSAASQEIPRIFGTRRFITVPTSARHLSLS